MIKKVIVVISLFLFFFNMSAQVPTITLRTEKMKGDIIKFKLVAGGAVSIDWGDGKPVLEDVSKNFNISSLHSKKILANHTEIKISGINITFLQCSDNEITSLDVSQVPSLKVLQCNNNYLLTLNLENNTDLVTLWCGMNPLKELKVSNNLQLVNLSLFQTKVRKLDLSKNLKLASLVSAYNSLGELTLSTNKALRELDCRNNGLTKLDLTNNPNVTSISLYNDGPTDANELDACALNSLYLSLPVGMGMINVINSLYNGDVDNDFQGSNKKLAGDRGWVVYDKNESKELVGDGGGCKPRKH